MERSEADEIKRIDNITQEISPTFCFAKWYHANIYFQTGSFDNIYGVCIIGFLGLFLAYFYTAEPLKFSSRKGLGELTIFLTFGPLLTLGSFFAMSNTSIEISFQLMQNFVLIDTASL